MKNATILFLCATLASTLLLAWNLWKADKDRAMADVATVRNLRVWTIGALLIHLAGMLYDHRNGLTYLTFKDAIGVFVAIWLIANFSQRIGRLHAKHEYDRKLARMMEDAKP